MALVEIDTLFDGVEAQIMHGRLQAAGIDGVLFDGAIASLIGPGLSGVRLLVEEGDEDAARALLADPQ